MMPTWAILSVVALAGVVIYSIGKSMYLALMAIAQALTSIAHCLDVIIDELRNLR